MGTLSPQFGSILPSQEQQLLNTNYLQFNTGGANDFIQQYLPEVYEQEVERYGNRTLSGFLRMVGAEMPMTSDQVIWSEQNRLHIAYDGVSITAVGAGTTTLTIAISVAPAPIQENVMSINDTVVVLDPATGLEAKCIVTASTVGIGGTIEVTSFQDSANDLTTQGFSASGLKVFVYGSAYTKGTSIDAGGAGNSNVRNSVEPRLTQYANSPVIIRDQYVVSGSDMAQIGWVEVATEDGASGYLWYLKSESETRLRFEDYLEMVCVEGELNDNAGAGVYQQAQLPGTQGLFAAIEDRGNVEVGFTAATGISDFDEILKNLDTQGAIEENMLFLQRQTALDFDDMLASISSGAAGGTAFGLFENSEEMALNLGFSGFRRGSYDFYKTDWKYLNDASTRGAIDGINSIEGVLVPAGTSTVYDQILGTNIRRPFLHVRYRASQADDRRMKSWITGSAGGAFTSTLDAMEVNFLSERCLVTQAANNFVLFKGV
tara:strand:+ start:4852 stop:6318 length:1467 start_codon:yes stop_codon:yes gene_type:complete